MKNSSFTLYNVADITKTLVINSEKYFFNIFKNTKKRSKIFYYKRLKNILMKKSSMKTKKKKEKQEKNLEEF